MLTSEQSIVEYRAGRVFPDRLTQKTHRHYVDYAERMLAVYRDGIGRRRRELHRQVETIFAEEPDCPVRRIEAFCKLLDDASVFQSDPSGKAAKLRLDIFSKASRRHPLVQTPDQLFEHEEAVVKSQLAAELGMPWDVIEESLYADVIAHQRLEQFTGYLEPVPDPGGGHACDGLSLDSAPDSGARVRRRRPSDKLSADSVRGPGPGVPPQHVAPPPPGAAVPQGGRRPGPAERQREAVGFLSRYNVAQLQACLYRAESMTVAATRDLKTIVRYAKLAKLLHEITRSTGIGPQTHHLQPGHPIPHVSGMGVGPVSVKGGRGQDACATWEQDAQGVHGRDDRAAHGRDAHATYRITFSGPASVLHGTRRYGVNFARFLPVLLACRGWTLEAVLRTPWKTPARLVLSDADGFSSHLPPPEEFDSSLEESFAEKFGPSRDGWQLIREGDLLHEHQTTFVPDFTFRHEDGTEVFLEIVGFWTPEYLAHRRETLRRFRRHRLLLAVPEDSIRADATVGDNVIVYKTALNLVPLLAALEAARGGSK
jgi:predicted nuclease of restriction endonuclease-like RecB superfamily